MGSPFYYCIITTQVCPSATLTLAPARRPLEGIIIIPGIDH
jgi:hypothetical protein